MILAITESTRLCAVPNASLSEYYINLTLNQLKVANARLADFAALRYIYEDILQIKKGLAKQDLFDAQRITVHPPALPHLNNIQSPIRQQLTHLNHLQNP